MGEFWQGTDEKRDVQPLGCCPVGRLEGPREKIRDAGKQFPEGPDPVPHWLPRSAETRRVRLKTLPSLSAPGWSGGKFLCPADSQTLRDRGHLCPRRYLLHISVG